MSGRLIRRLYAAAGALVAALVPVPEALAAEERPIVYAVVIDGLDGDRVDAGKAPFIASLLAGQGARATYYRESRSVLLSETNPNHVAMMTGAYGGASGIPGNAFALYAPLASEDSCTPTGPEDLSKPPSETSGESSGCLLAQTVFEAIKRQGNPDRLATAAIFGKPKLGRIFAGRNADPGAYDPDHLWAPCDAEPDDDAYCGQVPTNPVSGYALDDATVMDEVIRTIDEGIAAAGGVKRPDFTLVNLHQVDSAGHAFGTASGAYDTAIAQADDQVARLVGKLRERGEWSRTVLILLSDHSMDTTPAKLVMRSRFADAGIPEDAFLMVDNGGADGVYLADRTSPDRFALVARMRRIALETEGVQEALYREPNPADGGAEHTLAAVHPGWRLAGARAPDLVLTAEPGVAFSDPELSSNPLIGNHGGSTTRDNFLAVISGGEGVVQQDLRGEQAPLFDDTERNPRQAENVDVAPTVMGLFGLVAPRDSQGRFLAEAFDLDRLQGLARPVTPRLSLRGRRRARGGCTYTAVWGPVDGVWDLQIRSGGRWTKLRRRTAAERKSFRGRAGRHYAVRVRARAESGVHSRWTTRSIGGARACA